MKSPFTYLFEFEYLGFRFHGWAKQPGVKTVHHMIDRTFNYVLGHDKFKSMGSSRTDARVSARSFFVQLFMETPIDTSENFLSYLNANLPADIKALSVQVVDERFNIIQSPKFKEYRYYFYFGPNKYPFAAPFMSYFPGELNIDLMTEGASLFEGIHDFRRYATQPSPETDTSRHLLKSKIILNDEMTGSMLPPESYVYVLQSKGFLRHQIRLMTGQLVQLGLGNITLESIEESLKNPGEERLDYIAPGSGLVLYRTEYGLS